ncbi:3-hydroxyisobutyrate dehydrogenase [Kytococcus sp. Marseille-QA3725]
MKIAFLGLGNMGGPMAANLVKAGHEVTGFDPVPEAREKAEAAGVTLAGTGAEAVADAEAVITMLPNGKLVLDSYAEIVPAAKGEDVLFIDSSTIDVDSARKAADVVREAGHSSIDAPVSGGVVGSEAGTLTFMVGGTEEAFGRAKPILEVMGRKIVHCGGAGNGQAAKICNNMLLGVQMVAVSEAFVLGEKLGLDPQAFFDVASTSSGRCWALDTNCPVPGPVEGSPSNRDYAGGFATGLMLKDLNLAQDASELAGVDTAFGRAARDAYERFAEIDGPKRDFGAVITAIQDGTLNK